ncbi:MAG: FtsB family cell division protein [Marmoricola sp.]
MSPTGRTPQRGRPARNGRPGRADASRTRPRAHPGAARARQDAAPAASRPRFTHRMAVLLVVVAVLVVSYASSMRAYLQQRQDLDGLRAQIASSQAQIAELKQEKRRWRDPAYVEQQARTRFGWVMPGETAYQVIGADGKPLSGTDALSSPPAEHHTPEAWWSKAWSSVQAADHPPQPGDGPHPLTKIAPSRQPSKG